MAGTNKPVGGSVSQCPRKDSAKKKKEKEPKYKNIKIKCKHRICPADSYLKTFELVPDKEMPVYDEVLVDWTGKNPSPPATLTVIDSGKSKSIAGPPYKIPISSNLAEKLFPKEYEEKSKSGTVEFGKDLLKTITTYNKKRSLTIDGLPDGRFQVEVYNPDVWKLEVKFPLPGRYEKKTGTKWDKTYGAGVSKTNDYSETTGSHTLTTKTDASRYDDLLITKTTGTIEGEGATETNTSTAIEIGKRKMTFVETPVKKVSPTHIVTLSKNSSPLSITGLGILHFIFQLMKWIQNMNQILDNVPKAGAYFEFAFSVLEGGFSLEWGWKEYAPDHRAYYNVKGEFDILLLNIKLEFGVGASAISFKFQAFAAINGALNIKASLENTEPFKGNGSSMTNDTTGAADGPLKATITGSIIGSIGARCEALYLVKIEAKVSTGLELIGNCSIGNTDAVFMVDGTLRFTGIIGILTTSIGLADVNGEATVIDAETKLNKATGSGGVDIKTAGSGGIKNNNKKTVFVDPKDITSFKWPDALNKVKEDEIVPDKKLKAAIKDMINGKYLNNGFFNGKKIRVKRYLSHSELNKQSGIAKFVKYGVLNHDPVIDQDEDKLVNTIFDKVNKQKYFDDSKKSIELFLSEVHEDLVPLMIDREGHRMEGNYIEWSDFKKYINGKDFYARVKNHQDSAKEFYDVNCKNV